MRPPLVSAMRLILLVASLSLTSAPLAAQATDHIARGDEAYAALRPVDALTHYEAAVAEDSAGYEALWKASRVARRPGGVRRRQRQARPTCTAGPSSYAQRAVAVNPGDAEAHFHLARALGRVALSLGPKDRVKYGKAVREHALEALRLDPDHPGALHVMGMWNAEVCRLQRHRALLREELPRRGDLRVSQLGRGGAPAVAGGRSGSAAARPPPRPRADLPRHRELRAGAACTTSTSSTARRPTTTTGTTSARRRPSCSSGLD